MGDCDDDFNMAEDMLKIFINQKYSILLVIVIKILI